MTLKMNSKNWMLAAGAAFLAVGAFAPAAMGADHRDSFAVDTELEGDYTDAFGWPDPDRPGNIILAASKTIQSNGGDITLWADTDANGASHVARSILDQLSQPYVVNQQELTVTPSIGIALAPRDGDDLDAWLAESSLMKRSFRICAIISGLIERRHPGQEKTGRQMTVSSDLIYDVLRAHEPDHILLRATYADAGSGLLDIGVTAVILMGRCTDAMKAKPALITVSIGQGGSAGVMTAGGPNHSSEVLGTMMYRAAFRDDMVGYSSTIATVIFFIALTIGLVQIKLQKDR